MGRKGGGKKEIFLFRGRERYTWRRKKLRRVECRDGERVYLGGERRGKNVWEGREGERVCLESKDGERVCLGGREGERVCLESKDVERVCLGGREGVRVCLGE